jgi:hypothetical protein
MNTFWLLREEIDALSTADTLALGVQLIDYNAFVLDTPNLCGAVCLFKYANKLNCF